MAARAAISDRTFDQVGRVPHNLCVRRPGALTHPENENARDLAASGAFRNDLVAHRIMHRPVQLLDRVSSFLVPCIFRLGQPCVSGLPRTQHAYAAPATNLRVAPNLQSISLCRRWIIELPRLSHLPRCRWRSPGLPRFLTLAAPLNRCRVAPPPALRLHRRWIPESPRVSHPSAVPIDQFTRLPRLVSPSVSPTTSFRVAPNPVSSGTG